MGESKPERQGDGTIFLGGSWHHAILTRKIQHNILHFVNSTYIFIIAINKLTKSLEVSKLTKNLRKRSQSVTYNTKELFQWKIGNLIWEVFENFIISRAIYPKNLHNIWIKQSLPSYVIRYFICRLWLYT